MRKAGFLLFIVIFSSQPHFADELKIIDSLKRNLTGAENEEIVQNYLSIAEYYRNLNVDSTIRYGLLAIEKAQEIDDKEKEAFSQRSLGVSYFYISDFENAMYYFRQSLKTYQSINHELGISNCYNGIGLVYELSLELDSAEYYLTESLRIRLKLDDFEQIASSYINIGNLFYYRNQLSIALEYYLKAMALYKELNLITDEGDAYNSIGIIYSELDKFEKALDYYNNADSIFRYFNNARSLSKILLNKADIYNFHLNNYNEALIIYRESLAIKTKLSDKSGIALINNNIGTVYGNMENYKLALFYLDKAKQLYSDLNNKAGLIMTNHNLGSVYFAKSNYKKAIDYFSFSLREAKKTGFNDYVTLNYKGLIKAYAANNDYENFEKYLNLENHITDSLLTNLEQAQLLEVEANFLANELQKENINLKDLNTRLARKAKTRIYIIIGLAILILIGIVFQIIYYISQKKNHIKNS